jgi:hypothetical protein
MEDPHLRDEALAARDADTHGAGDDEDYFTAAELARDGEEMEARRRARVRAGLVRCRDGWTRRRAMRENGEQA